MDNIYKGELIKELIKKDFDIKKSKVSLNPKITEGLNGILIIYAPWCEHCNLSRSMWVNLAKIFKYKFNFYALNTYNFKDKNQYLNVPLDIHEYPDIRFVKKNGEIVKYKGVETESEFMKFIVKNI